MRLGRGLGFGTWEAGNVGFDVRRGEGASLYGIRKELRHRKG